ncbi:MAG: hypothetical protein CV089_25015 [Nitrospira sp. WS110]|nr:hypothetical protein [Nitrospira sp. WS110]
MNVHRIHRVAKLTGLSRDVIRVWERRFGLLKPTRGANRYRNYSDEDVALLRYLKEQLDAGASIGDLARVGREELMNRVRAATPRATIVDNTFNRLLRELLSALEPLDRVTFETAQLQSCRLKRHSMGSYCRSRCRLGSCGTMVMSTLPSNIT